MFAHVHVRRNCFSSHLTYRSTSIAVNQTVNSSNPGCSICRLTTVHITVLEKDGHVCSLLCAIIIFLGCNSPCIVIEHRVIICVEASGDNTTQNHVSPFRFGCNYLFLITWLNGLWCIHGGKNNTVGKLMIVIITFLCLSVKLIGFTTWWIID